MRIRIGKGEVVSQLGYTDSGIPCVIVEPVKECEVGTPGQPGPDYLNRGDVVEGGVVLEIHGLAGAMVLMEDIAKAATRIGGPREANTGITV